MIIYLKMKLNKYQTLSILLILFRIVISSINISNINNIIILPLKNKNIPINNIEKEKSSDPLGLIINKIIPNNLFLDIKINSHNIEFPGYLTFNSLYNYYGKDSCIKIENNSVYEIYSPQEKLSGIKIFSNKYHEYYILKENITIFTINKSNNNYNLEEIEEMDIIIPEGNERKAECLILGLYPHANNKSNILLKNLPLSIKSNKNNNFKTYFTFLYNNTQKDKDNIIIKNNDLKNNENIGLLIIGELPHIIYPKLFNNIKYKEINNYNMEKNYGDFYSKDSDKNPWSIEINKIYLNNKFIFIENITGIFSIDYAPFLVPIELFNNYINIYLKDYINNYICYKKGRPLSKYFTHTLHDDKRQIFIFIYCEKNKIENSTKFYDTIPTLKLTNNLLNKTFEFSGKELFVEDDENIYFMLIPDIFNKNRITLGKIFMEKYLFTFNYDYNKIGFYDFEFNNNKINSFLLNHFSLLFFKVSLFIIFFGAIIMIMINYIHINTKNLKNNNEEELINIQE